MFTHVTTLALIFAVFACPLRCGLGQCEDTSGGGAEVASAAPIERFEHENAGCCCCQPLPTEQKQPAPRHLPRESSCQGICGGAVLERPCEWTGGDQPCVAPVILSDETFTCGHLAVTREHQGCERLAWDLNHGRLLRILHQSFLC